MTRAASLLLLLAAGAGAGEPAPRNARIDAAVEAVQPAVVKVFGIKGFRGIYGYMTGVIVHESGLVITRGSVTLDEAPQINCHLHDGRRLQARIVREDRRSKMTLLLLIGAARERFPAATLGESTGVRSGQFVLLVGNAYQVALGSERCAVNLGIVNAVAKLAMREGMDEFPYDMPVILHDAMNNPGVYGGPLVDLSGRVIGISGTIVESRATNVQAHYAIPIDDLKPFILDTLERPDAPLVYAPAAPHVPEGGGGPGYHGLRVLKGGINRATPAYIDRVDPASPAAEAGIRPDDLVLKVDETPVASWKAFDRVMATYRAGQTARLLVKRKEEVLVIPITLREEKAS
ncbi:MAG: S1C family serine protease [Planctomycetaceae bacterium]